MDYSEKTHFIFHEIEKPKGPNDPFDTRLWHDLLVIRASRHSRLGRFALQYANNK